MAQTNERDLAAEVIDWLQGLPSDAIVRWGQDVEQPAEGWLDGLVDVGVDGDGCPDCGWLWSIAGPDDNALDVGGPSCPLYLVVDHDGWYWSVTHGGEVVAAHLVEDDAPLDPRIHGELEGTAAACGGHVRCSGCWRVETINAVLGEWSAAHAGRNDLTFSFGPEVHTLFCWEFVRRIDPGSCDMPS